MSGAGVAIRPYGPQDEGAFLDLLADCARHYGTVPASTEMRRAIAEELAAPFGTDALIAWDGAQAVGFACIVRVFPLGEGFAHYLKELYVTEAARGLGAGRALMTAAARRARGMGASRLQWESLEPDAIRFYDALGLPRTGKTHYALADDALAAFAGAPA